MMATKYEYEKYLIIKHKADSKKKANQKKYTIKLLFI